MSNDAPAGTATITCHRCGTSSIEPPTGLVMCRQCGTQVRPRYLEATRFVLDANIYDYLVETPDRQHRAIDAHASGQVEFLMTTV